MPLQNRVAPDGALFATPERGAWMGNRGGRFHNPVTQTLGARRWASRQWICCLLQFRNRQRAVWTQGYTELFFCDEVSALAAGHRPCFECRRTDAKAFALAVQAGLGLAQTPRADELDRRLHRERVDGRSKKLHPVQDVLPDGAMIQSGGRFYAIRHGAAHGWLFRGYEPALPDIPADAQLVTPPTIVSALRAGYTPRWHDSIAALHAS